MRFAFIQTEKAHYPVNALCSALEVSRAGFYAFCKRPESIHAREDRRLKALLRAAHARSKGRYGSPRLHDALSKQEVFVSRKRVIRLMHEEELVGRRPKRFKNTTVSDPSHTFAPNLLDRKFEADAPNKRWVGDTTELLTSSGKVYLAVVLDLFSRFVVGWALSAVNDRHLTMKALAMALKRRCPDASLLHHSDRGSPYTSEDYQKMLEVHGVTVSMSRTGNCYDNAAMESWFSTLKAELGEKYESPKTAKHELFEYIEMFYNQQRTHSTLGYLSPGEYEARARMNPAA